MVTEAAEQEVEGRLMVDERNMIFFGTTRFLFEHILP